MTDWIEHTTDTCPVDPETVVEVRYRNGLTDLAIGRERIWAYSGITSPAAPWHITHYRIVTPAKPACLDDPDPGADPAKPPEPEMTKTAQERAAAMFATAIKPEPDLITLRLECLKLAVNDHFYEAGEPDYEQVADRFLHYVLNGSVDKAP